MENIKKTILQMLVVIASICIYSSCSGDDYINTIPGNSNALISVDIKKTATQFGNDNNSSIIESLFHTKNAEDCGIDLDSKLYFYETTEGNLGCCAKVNDEDALKDWLNELSRQGLCNKVTERREMCYSLLRNSWAICFNSKSLLLMGPILPAQEADAIRTLSRCLKQKEDDGIKATPLYEKIDSINSPVSIVAQVDALPEKIAAPFTIGAPKEADASQIIIAASIDTGKNGCLKISGESFSFNSSINKALKEGTGKFRKLNGRYINNMPGNTLCSIFMNVNGKEFVKMLHNSTGLGMLLAGMNTAIDMDNILKSVDGDMMIGVNSYSENNIKMTMAAQLAQHGFLKDVDYWKKSCPDGSSITDWGHNSFCFKSGDTNFWFGVSDSNEFYGSTDKATAIGILKPSPAPLSSELRKTISEQRFCMALNIRQIITENKEYSTITDMLAPLFGKINYVIYCIK